MGTHTRAWIGTILFTLLAPGSVTILAPYSLIRWASSDMNLTLGVYRWLGLVPILIGILFYAWTVSDFVRKGGGTPAPIDPPQILVVDGLYRFVRNPMYVGVISVLIGELLLFEKMSLIAYTTVVFFAFHLFVVLYEEPRLGKTFGKAYEEYCSSVPRWIPKISRTRNI
ncbi:MAG: isoprenylcysteine carboxyl methyltransferase [Anaerolineales bacterium]|nr:isoprenylcysteine carboxyl methyltransferase [Anaerolineales bacterium]